MEKQKYKINLFADNKIIDFSKFETSLPQCDWFANNHDGHTNSLAFYDLSGSYTFYNLNQYQGFMIEKA